MISPKFIEETLESAIRNNRLVSIYVENGAVSAYHAEQFYFQNDPPKSTNNNRRIYTNAVVLSAHNVLCLGYTSVVRCMGIETYIDLNKITVIEIIEKL